MTKAEAKRWACGMAAAIVAADVASGYIPAEDEPDRKMKLQAMREVVRELERRGDTKRGATS